MRIPLPSFLPLILTACWLSDAEVQGKFADTGSDAGDADTDTDADSDTDADADTDADTDTDLACIDQDLASAVGNGVVSGDNTTATDDFTPDCHGASTSGGPDVAFAWTAPSAGCFAFDTSESTYDTLLYLLDGCSGAELACNDDFDANTVQTSMTGYEVASGQTLVAVIDGYDASATGTYQLDINPTDRIEADGDKGSQVGVVNGSTAGADTNLMPALCEWDSGADLIYTWTAPSSDVWTFSLSELGTTFDSVLSLHRQCTPDAFVCDDSISPTGGESVDAVLFAGEQILVRVAGYDAGGGPASGGFELNITN